MRIAIKRIADFIVFRNVFIAFAAACLVAETRLLSGNAWSTIDPLLAFTFFATFFVYNFHSFSNHLADYSVPHFFKALINPFLSLEQRICVSIGLAGTLITFFFLDVKMMLLMLPAAIVTLAYTLPLLKLKAKSFRLREIIYVKIFTVALMWAVATLVLPWANDNSGRSFSFYALLFTERLLFIYAITIPFEIRDRHRELDKGIRTIPGVYGMEKSKKLGYIVLLLYCLTVFIREFVSMNTSDSSRHFAALMLSALSAGILIFNTADNNNRWYYKFLLDGTMIEQFLLLILVQILSPVG